MRGQRQQRAFTLVELMIVVAIIGVLAALGIQTVSRYIGAAKASEAKNGVGHISRSAHAAYEDELQGAQLLAEGGTSALTIHRLCGTAVPVPGYVPPGKKYQPRSTEGVDFKVGDSSTGWPCLRFEIYQPIYYQYSYAKGDSPVALFNPGKCPTGENCYEAGAMGDLNGDGAVFSRYARTGHVNATTGELRVTTQIYVENEEENQ
jgi:type IV pilus assembly protein PilA